jgi:plastocyanin
MRRLPRLTLIAGLDLAGGALGATLAAVMSARAPPTAPPIEVDPALPTTIAIVAANAQATTGSAAINIVEPPFKPPATWKYEPAALTVKLGTEVTWTNTGAVVHTVTAADRKAFDSRNIGPKARFSWTFQSAGTFAYFCTYHPWMKGTIVVQP